MDDEIEIRIWHENGDFLGFCGSVDDAEYYVEHYRNTCSCGTEGLPECGVIHPHGYFFDIVDNGYVNRNDYLY